MKKETKKIIILTVILLLIIGICTSIVITEKNKKEEKEVSEKTKSKKLTKETKNKENNIIEDETAKINQTEVQTDEEFVTYISNVESEVTRIAEQKTITEADKNTLKNTFITLTDFIFYEGEIKGKTFAELKDESKVKDLDLYNKIDTKIESVSPNYKENIKTTSQKVYTNVKEKASNLKDKIQSEYIDHVGEEAYNNTKSAWEEDKQNVKDVYEYYEPTIDAAKDKAKETYENTKDKISDWYQGYKEGN